MNSNLEDCRPARQRLLDALTAAGCPVTNGGRAARCPAHNDNAPSLSIGDRADGDGVVIRCHAGCDTEDILTALRLGKADLFDNPRTGTDRPRIVAAYDYCDERGTMLFQKVRMVPKTFRQRHPVGRDWQWNLNGTRRVLYRLPELLATDGPVYLCEGEKDADALTRAGVTATTWTEGAWKPDSTPKWRPEYTDTLKGRHVVIVRDRDEPGRHTAAIIAGLLDGTAASVRIVEPAEGKDAADHLAAGHGLAELVPVSDTSDTSDTTSDDARPRLWNATDLAPAKRQKWLATGRLPKSAVTILVGDEGIGKSLFWVWIVAAITTGSALPEFGIPAREPGTVVLVFTEDEWSETIRPRLDVAGANLDNIRVICTEEDGSGSPVFPRDMPLIYPAEPALVVVDAFLDTVPGKLVMKDPQQARIALHPWKELATVTGAAVLLLTHTNRVDSKNARDRYGITGELRKKARMTLYAQLDTEDDALVIGPEKTNITSKRAASKFAVDVVRYFEPTEDNDGMVPRLRYVGESTLTAREHLEANYEADHGEETDDRTAADKWLEDVLRAAGDWVKSKDLKVRAKKEAGISERSLQRSAHRLKVDTDDRGFPRLTYWRWPDSGASGAKEETRHSEGGATGATVPDKGKRAGATVQSRQLRHVGSNGATVGTTADPGLFKTVSEVSEVSDCTVCGFPLPSALADAGETTHPTCDPEGESA